MRISLVRTGGVAGTRKEAAVDMDTLEPSRSEELRRLLETADLEQFAMQSRPSRRPDRFRYALTIEEEGGLRREVVFGEEEATERVQRLLEALWRESETEPPDIRRA